MVDRTTKNRAARRRGGRRCLALLLALVCLFLSAAVDAAASGEEAAPSGEQAGLPTAAAEPVPESAEESDPEPTEEVTEDALPDADGAPAEATPLPSPLAEQEEGSPAAETDGDDRAEAGPLAAARVLRFCVGLSDEAPAVPAWAMTDGVIGAYTAAALLEVPGKTPETPVPEPSLPPKPVTTPEPVSRAEKILAGMSLREKVWQLLIVRPSDLDPSCVRTVTSDAREALSDCPVGGVIFFAVNMESKDQVRSLLAGLQEASAIPLLMMCDEEGGTVSRLMRTVGTTQIGPMLSYKDMGTDTAYANARTIGADMSALGFNMDLAPVADVRSNPSNTAIGTRAYSDSFTQAAELIPAAVRGFHDGGVACTLKHFPGHGDTTADTHDGTVFVYKTLEELRRGELLSFQAGIDAGADAVMIGHLTVPDVYGEPALFSYALVTELLRGEMGFTGIVISDALEMKALSDHYDTAGIAVRAIQAGVDMLLLPEDPQAAAEALVSAVERGGITEARIDESVMRVLTLKERRGLL